LLRHLMDKRRREVCDAHLSKLRDQRVEKAVVLVALQICHHRAREFQVRVSSCIDCLDDLFAPLLKLALSRFSAKSAKALSDSDPAIGARDICNARRRTLLLFAGAP